MISLNKINKNYGKVNILKNISLNIGAQEQCVIWGKSGSGKSSLLYLLGGLEKATSGTIEVDDKRLDKMTEEELAHYRRDVLGFIFQFHFLLPTLTCWENILLPLKLHPQKKIDSLNGVNGKSMEEVAKEWCLHLGLDSLLDQYPYQVSGGEQQRFSLLRALMTKPRLILCDEPTGNLDSQNAHLVMDLLQRLSAEFKATLVVVTHDQDIASRFRRKIIIEDGCVFS